MKIGVVGPIWLPIPPRSYGGTEGVIYNLVNGLVEKGHDVTLFGAKTDAVKAHVYPTVSAPLREDKIEWTNVDYTLYHLTEAFDNAAQFDVLHVHINKNQDYIAFPLALYAKTPVLFTLHFRLPSENFNHDRYQLLQKYNVLPFTSISNAQRGNEKMNFIKTVYNAFRLEDYSFSATPEDYFVWLGKVRKEKGTKEAILLAKKAGIKLYIMGAVDTGVPEMLQYYEKEVKPLIDGKQIVWLGEADLAKKVAVLGKARAFLNPLQWDEPFGLVMTESQAVGTPVIALNKGSVPELVVHGKTGFVVDTLDEMVEAIKKIDTIDRLECRRHIEEKFTVSKMIQGYEDSYTVVQEKWEEYLSNQTKQMQKQAIHISK